MTVTAATFERPSASRPGPSARALIRLFDSRLQVRLGAQVAKVLAALLTLGYAIAVPFAARAPAGDTAANVVVHALAWLSWLPAGMIAMSACGKEPSDEDAALTALALARGFRPSEVAWARALATARRTVRLVGFPALVLGVLALGFVRRAALLPVRVALIPAALGYVALLSASIALFVHLARLISPDRSRTTFLLLIFVPHVLHALLPQVPSLPWVLGWGLDQMAILGGRAL